MQHRQELLDEKKRRTHIHGKQGVEVLHARLFYCRGLGYTGVGNQDVQALANDFTGVGSEPVRPVRGGKVRLHSIRPPTGLADTQNNPLGLGFAAAVMHENPCARSRQSDGGGAPYHTRGASDERRFSNQSDLSFRPGNAR